jgi:manganese oxidase
MKDMTEMEMPLPDNTAPMMAGQGPFGAIGMGGMFSVLKVRKGLARHDYRDPGWFKHPPGTVAYEYRGPAPAAHRQAPAEVQPGDVEVTVRKPGHGHHHGKKHGPHHGH